MNAFQMHDYQHCRRFSDRISTYGYQNQPTGRPTEQESLRKKFNERGAVSRRILNYCVLGKWRGKSSQPLSRRKSSCHYAVGVATTTRSDNPSSAFAVFDHFDQTHLCRPLALKHVRSKALACSLKGKG